MTSKPTSNGSQPATAHVVSSGGVHDATRALPEEVPVALVYNGTTQAVMMATPTDLEDFGRGFTRTEGLGDVDQLDVEHHVNGIEVRMWLPDAQASELAARRRAMAGPVGCGLCGIDSLEEATRAVVPVEEGLALTQDHIVQAMADLRAQQRLHDQTRAVHGAGFFAPGRGLMAIREDVGRHNALDKLIGAVGSCSGGAVVLTSRVSVELVQKAAAARAPIMVAVSAPTTLAVQTAQAAGITLVALARDTTFEIFTHPHRIDVAHRNKEAPDVA